MAAKTIRDSEDIGNMVRIGLMGFGLELMGINLSYGVENRH